MNEEHKKTARPDFISSTIICVVSVVIFILSLAMPKYEEWGLYATPSLAPMVFSITLFLCGALMLVRSIIAKGYRISISKEKTMTFLRSKILKHFLVALGFVLIYYVFFGVLHFVLISAVYLFLNIFFYRSTSWWKALILSVLYTGAIWYCFNFLFLIPLP